MTDVDRKPAPSSYISMPAVLVMGATVKQNSPSSYTKLAVWLSGNKLVSINVVTLHWVHLIL